MHDKCEDGMDPRHEWNVTLPAKNSTESGNVTVLSREASKTPIKVLQITDIHLDLYYKEGADADCDMPMCCRASSGSPKTKKTAAGKWGSYRKCDSPQWLVESAFKHIRDTHTVKFLVLK